MQGVATCPLLPERIEIAYNVVNVVFEVKRKTRKPRVKTPGGMTSYNNKLNPHIIMIHSPGFKPYLLGGMWTL